ncbi:MAG: cobalt ECF transporter T component CbiQ [Clostridia bacterium]|nr:cobalt ECF transporter T component CbiQ [Clostridia bacterium]
MLIDRLSYMSRLRDINPLLKVLTAFFSIVICIWADSFVISILTLLSMTTLITCFGGTKIKYLLHLMTVPASFVMLGSAAAVLIVSSSRLGMSHAFSLGSIYIGISKDSIITAFRIMIKCFGSLSCMYFLSLTTPMIDLFGLLRRSILPDFIVEIMELVYRYIFVLHDASDRIHTAQDSRLGYSSLRLGCHSVGVLAANVFIRAYRQADKTYTAMESRGYNGEIRLLKGKYARNIHGYIAMSVFVMFMAITAIICRRYGV